MWLGCAYERRNAAPLLALPAPLARPPHSALSTTSIQGSSSSSSLAPPPRPFKRLTPDEMAERRKQGLYYNCDKTNVHSHKCACLFYLEVSDYIMEEPKEADDEAALNPHHLTLKRP